MSGEHEEWLRRGARPTGVPHLKLHVQMERDARQIRRFAIVLLVVTIVNLAFTLLSIGLRVWA